MTRPVGLDDVAPVGQVDPARGPEAGRQLAPGQLDGVLGMRSARVRQEVAPWVLGGRPDVVVRAHDERPGDCQMRFERVQEVRHGVEVRPVVAGVHDQVGVERGQVAHPVDLAPLPRHQVQVRQVQDAQRFLAGRQYRHGDLTQRVPAHLDERGSTRAPPPRRRPARQPRGRPHGWRLVIRASSRGRRCRHRGRRRCCSAATAVVVPAVVVAARLRRPRGPVPGADRWRASE